MDSTRESENAKKGLPSKVEFRRIFALANYSK